MLLRFVCTLDVYLYLLYKDIEEEEKNASRTEYLFQQFVNIANQSRRQQ